MKNHSTIAIALGDRIKQTARALGLDVALAAQRHVGDRILDYIGPHITAHVVSGGHLWPQTLRPTGDLDLIVPRQVSNREIQRAFKIIAPALAREGITISRLSVEPHEISVGDGEPILRWSYVATCGTVRANSHIDFRPMNGPYAYPHPDIAPIKHREVKSIMKNGPAPFPVRMQHLATAAAEKLLAVIMQPEADYRVRHLADLVDDRLWDGIDCRQVAVEVLRVTRHRGIPLSVCQEKPDALDWSRMKRLDGSWDKLRAAGRTEMTLGEAHEYIRALWADVHAEMRAEIIREVRRPNYRSTLLDSIVAGKNPVTEYNRAYKPRETA